MGYIVKPKKIPKEMNEQESLEWELDCMKEYLRLDIKTGNKKAREAHEYRIREIKHALREIAATEKEEKEDEILVGPATGAFLPETEPEPKPEPKKEKKEKKKKKDSDEFKCQVCGKVCKSGSGLASHAKIHDEKEEEDESAFLVNIKEW